MLCFFVETFYTFTKKNQIYDSFTNKYHFRRYGNTH